MNIFHFFQGVCPTDFMAIVKHLVYLMKLLIRDVFDGCSYFIGSFKRVKTFVALVCLKHFSNEATALFA